MQKKSVTCFNQGMSRDLGISQLSEQKANFAFENHNIRITAIDDNTLYTVTNEKGTKDTDIVLEGTFLGSCNINKYIVVFTTYSEKDFIYRLSVEDNHITSYLLSEGDLNFNVNNPNLENKMFTTDLLEQTGLLNKEHHQWKNVNEEIEFNNNRNIQNYSQEFNINNIGITKERLTNFLEFKQNELDNFNKNNKISKYTEGM